MSNNPTTKKQNNVHPSFHKELFELNLRSASDHYGKYLDKILEVTGGKEPDQSVTIKVVYDYEEFNKRE